MAIYEEQRKWADRFIDEIRQIVGPQLLQVAPLKLDTQQATDLIVMEMPHGGALACRIREYRFKQNFGRQFTIRTRSNGHRTEWHKVIDDGWGDLMFYGFASAKANYIVSWYLIDLHALRHHWQENRQQIVHDEIDNHDGTWFRWFLIDSFPNDPPLVLGHEDYDDL